MKDAIGFPTLLETFFTRPSSPSAKPVPIRSPLIGTLFDCYCNMPRSGWPRRIEADDRGLKCTVSGSVPGDLESTRTNGARSRNLRLTAIRSFFRFAALEDPQHSGLIQREIGRASCRE